MTDILTVGEKRCGSAITRILSLGKSGAATIATNRYIHLAVITVGVTLAVLVLIEVSVDLAFTHP